MIPGWFDQSLVETLVKKYDRSDIEPGKRTLDWSIRQILKLMPLELTGIDMREFAWSDIESIIAENTGKMFGLPADKMKAHMMSSFMTYKILTFVFFIIPYFVMECLG
ncbi:hypothetical protein COV93_08645 [Candidatus Woesearchaeota archaeon CG11_big_fil_rev_8_21_14_0_20_43_8]|nr:MAG: hypothetical protein COV93_08645 [Candidatus Woesearchaeota archaeon CG11_big_fil_rev_8_21_14_0_20_43_8]PIO05375.1 MAG: hypothetical protein COT47_05060 [Candidatus Woesearchaeota archaeon CG08_land_8_20_14_0_20_43_7]